MSTVTRYPRLLPTSIHHGKHGQSPTLLPRYPLLCAPYRAQRWVTGNGGELLPTSE
jgi:hypothetical protein